MTLPAVAVVGLFFLLFSFLVGVALMVVYFNPDYKSRLSHMLNRYKTKKPPRAPDPELARY